jgi:hypothetical protein
MHEVYVHLLRDAVRQLRTTSIVVKPTDNKGG